MRCLELIETKKVESAGDDNSSVDEDFRDLEKKVDNEQWMNEWKEDKWDGSIADSKHSDSEEKVIPNLQDFEDSKKDKEFIYESFNREKDWYIPTSNIKKSLVLQVLYVIKDFLSGIYTKEPKRLEIQNKIMELPDTNPHFTENIKELNWDKLRGIMKAMWCKYKKDKENHWLEKCKSNVRLSIKLWETEKEKYVNL